MTFLQINIFKISASQFQMNFRESSSSLFHYTGNSKDKKFTLVSLHSRRRQKHFRRRIKFHKETTQ